MVVLVIFFVSSQIVNNIFTAAVSKVVNPYVKLSDDDLIESIENLPVPNAMLNAAPSAPEANLLENNPPPAYDNMEIPLLESNVELVSLDDANKTVSVPQLVSENLELPQRQAILDRAKNRLLINCASSGKFKEFIDLLKDPSIQIDVVDENGSTPLLHACNAILHNSKNTILVNNCLEIVKTLLELKADLNKPNNVGISPLNVAYNSAYLINLLLKSGADVKGKLGDSESLLTRCLRNAMKVDNWDSIKILLENKADAKECKDSLIKLLQHDGTVNYPSCGNEVIKLMLANNVDINSQYVNSNFLDATRGITPLIWAVKHGDVEVVADLLSRKADVNLEEVFVGEWTTKPRTALEYAKANKNKEIIDLLESAGAKSGCCILM